MPDPNEPNAPDELPVSNTPLFAANEKIAKVNVGQPEFFKAADKILTSTPIEDWQVYLRWHLVNAASSTLSAKFVEESFNFNGKFLQGTTEMLPR